MFAVCCDCNAKDSKANGLVDLDEINVSPTEQIPIFVSEEYAQMDGKPELAGGRKKCEELMKAGNPRTDEAELQNTEFTQPSGATYAGQVKAGRKCGQGVYKNADATRTYSGSWENDRCHGKGHLVDPESSYYGFWDKGSKAGLGLEVWHSDNTLYLGDYKVGVLGEVVRFIRGVWVGPGTTCGRRTEPKHDFLSPGQRQARFRSLSMEEGRNPVRGAVPQLRGVHKHVIWRVAGRQLVTHGEREVFHHHEGFIVYYV